MYPDQNCLGGGPIFFWGGGPHTDRLWIRNFISLRRNYQLVCRVRRARGGPIAGLTCPSRARASSSALSGSQNTCDCAEMMVATVDCRVVRVGVCARPIANQTAEHKLHLWLRVLVNDMASTVQIYSWDRSGRSRSRSSDTWDASRGGSGNRDLYVHTAQSEYRH